MGKQVLQSKMKRLLAHLLKLKVFKTSVAGFAVEEYSELIKDELVQIKFQEFDRSRTRLNDDFFFNVVNIKLFKNVVKVVTLWCLTNFGRTAFQHKVLRYILILYR